MQQGSSLLCRSLQKHAAREEFWATQSVRLAATHGKEPSDVTLSRAFDFRQRREKLDLIGKSKPVHARVTSATFWQLTLRNAYTRWIPIGNEFSGVL